MSAFATIQSPDGKYSVEKRDDFGEIGMGSPSFGHITIDGTEGQPPDRLRSSSSVSFALAFDRMFAIPKRIALAGAVSVVVVVSFTVFWLFSLRPAYVATGTLSPADVREIVQIASRQRWQMVRYALVRRDFKLLRPFLRAHIDSVDGNAGPHGKASVRCSAGLDRGVQVIFNLVCEGTNGWKFERWFVIEGDHKKASKLSRPTTQLNVTNLSR